MPGERKDPNLVIDQRSLRKKNLFRGYLVKTVLRMTLNDGDDYDYDDKFWN